MTWNSKEKEFVKIIKEFSNKYNEWAHISNIRERKNPDDDQEPFKEAPRRKDLMKEMSNILEQLKQALDKATPK